MYESHFVCRGDCKTVSENPGICQADFCNKKGEELMICGCEDGSHAEGSHEADSEKGELSE